MQSKNIIIRNMFAQNSINTDNSDIHTTYILPDKSYKLDLYRTSKKLFSESNFNYYCKISISTILDTPMIDINMSELDMVRLVDTLYYSFEHNMGEIIFPILCNEYAGCKYRVIRLDIVDHNYEGYIYCLSIVDYIHDGSMINRIKINMDEDTIANIVDLLEETFLLDVKIENLENYDICTLSTEFDALSQLQNSENN